MGHGQCAGSPKFTHAAFDDYRVVRDNLAGRSRTTRNRLVPFCLFTDPELARVGLNEPEAKAINVRYRVAKLPMSMVLRTRTISQPRGLSRWMTCIAELNSYHYPLEKRQYKLGSHLLSNLSSFCSANATSWHSPCGVRANQYQDIIAPDFSKKVRSIRRKVDKQP